MLHRHAAAEAGLHLIAPAGIRADILPDVSMEGGVVAEVLKTGEAGDTVVGPLATPPFCKPAGVWACSTAS